MHGLISGDRAGRHHQGRANERLAKEDVTLVLSEHSFIGVDGKVKVLACGCKPEHAENHKFRTCRCGKFSKSWVLNKCGYQCRCEVKSSTVEVVPSLSSPGIPEPAENASDGRRKADEGWEQRSPISSTVQGDWIAQIYMAGDDNSESCEEHSKS